MTKKIGILIQTYNDGNYLKAALKSILKQTYKNIKIFVLDDGSNFNNRKKYLDFVTKNKKIKYIYKKNQGIIKSSQDLLILAVKSKCHYFAKMDGDDISHKQRINLQLNYLIKNKLDLVGCNYYRTNLRGKYFEKNICTGNEISRFNQLMVESIFAHGSIFFTKKIVSKKILKYTGPKFNLPYPEDYNMYCNIINKIKIGNVDKFLYFYRYHGDSYSELNKITYNSQLKKSSRLHYKKNKKLFRKLNNNFTINNYFDLLIYYKILVRHNLWKERWFVFKIIKSSKIVFLIKILNHYLSRKFNKFFYA